MSESIGISLIQNIAILLALAMLYENLWLRYDNPRGIPEKILTGIVLGGIGIVLMFTTWTMTPGIVFDTRSVMMAVSGLFFGAIPTIIAMTVAAALRFAMGGDGVLMGITVIVLSGSIGILWGKMRSDWQKKNMKAELLMLGIVVHLAMLGSTVLLPVDKMIPTLITIALPVMLIHAPGTMLLGLLMAAQKNNFENRMAKARLYDAEHKYGQDLLMKQKQLQNHLNKYSRLARKFKSQNVELKKAKDKAEESDRLKSSFLANLSHEIRTPMNAIVGFAELLGENELPDDVRKKYARIIQKNGYYLVNIIDDIIEISQIESGQVEMKNSELNLDVFLKEIYSTLLYSLTENKNIQLKLEKIPAEVPLIIISDEVKLKQVLINLLNNAIKFTTKGEVSFGCCLKDNKHLTFFVRDTGIGIDAKNHRLIFERFRQVDHGKEIRNSGSGLGLAIVKAYVRLMGGDVYVESESGKGSAFYFTVPLKSPKKSNLILNSDSDFNNMNSKESFILIAEDEDINWFLLDQILSPKNYKLLRASNGREAVNICRENDKIDLVLMDIKMPVMNGYEALQEIREFKPELPVIAQTAYALPSDVERLKKSFSDYITKPINGDLLLKKISSASGKEDRENHAMVY